MLAVEVIERPVPQPNLWTRGINNVRQRVGEALGRAPQPATPETQLDFNPISPEGVMKFIFEEAGEHIWRHIYGATFIDMDPNKRVEDGLTLQVALGRKEYIHTQRRGDNESALNTMADLMAMASLRQEYVENGIPDLLERDFPTPESLAEKVASIHQEDIDLHRGEAFVFYGNKLQMTDMAWFRRWFHDGAHEGKMIIGSVTFMHNEEDLQKTA